MSFTCADDEAERREKAKRKRLKLKMFEMAGYKFFGVARGTRVIFKCKQSLMKLTPPHKRTQIIRILW